MPINNMTFTSYDNLNENENSLRNMFINKVLENDDIDEETKEKVITYGLSKLMKEED